jgi:hypothetical protein
MTAWPPVPHLASVAKLHFLCKMKWTMRSCFVLVLLLLLVGCDRFSYREQYVGDFDFTTIRLLPDSSDHDSTTTIFAGTVTQYNNDALLLRFKADDSIAPNIAKDGVLTVPGFVASGGSFQGSFSDADHMSFTSEFRSYTTQRVRYVVTGARK